MTGIVLLLPTWLVASMCIWHAALWNYGLAKQTDQSPIPIGTIFGYEDDPSSRSALMYAIAMHNSNSDEAIKFRVYSETVNIHSPFHITSTMCSLMSTGVFAMFGSTSHHSQVTCQAHSEKFHMPFISNKLTGPISREPCPYMLFAKPVYADAVVDLIKYFQWKRVEYVYDSDEGLLRVQYVYDRLKRENYGLELGFRRVADTDSAHEDLRRLDYGGIDEMMNIVLDLSSPKAYNQLLKQISEVGMNRHNYNYILGSMDMETLDTSRFEHSGANLTGFQMIPSTSTIVQNFTRDWKELTPGVWPGAGGELRVRRSVTSLPEMDLLDAALSVDAVESMKRALTEMIEENRKVFYHTFRRKKVYNMNITEGIPCNHKPPYPWMHGESIYKALKQVRFEGLSGWVQFDEAGYRTNYSMDVLSVGMDTGMQQIGRWHSEYGIVSDNETWTMDEHGPPVDGYHPEMHTVGYGDVQHEEEQSWHKIITTMLEPPFLMKRDEVNDDGSPLTGNNKFKGYAKDLAEELKKRIFFDYILDPVSDGEYGRELANGSWTGMIGKLIRGEADLAIAPLTITAARERVVDFSKPFMSVGISMMSKRPEKQKPGLFSFLEPFSVMLWSSIVFSYFTVSCIIFAVTRISPYEPHSRRCCDGQVRPNFSMCNSFWFVMGALMMQGSDLCPRSTAGRILGGAWWFFVLIVISSYTANLAAFLTIERMDQPITNADDLAGQTDIAYGMLETGTTREFFEHSNVTTYQKMWTYMASASPPTMVKSMEAGVRRVQNSGGKYVMLLYSSHNDYYNNRKPCNTIRVGSNLNVEGYGIATPQGSDIKNDINYVTLTLKEKGVLHRLEEKWWREEGECGVAAVSTESKKRSLSLNNVAGAFLILIAGLVLAIATGLVEAHYLENIHHHSTPGIVLSRIEDNDEQRNVQNQNLSQNLNPNLNQNQYPNQNQNLSQNPNQNLNPNQTWDREHTNGHINNYDRNNF